MVAFANILTMLLS